MNQSKKRIISEPLKYGAPNTPGAGNGMIYQIVCWVTIIADSVCVETSADDGVDSIKDVYSGISMSLFELVWDWKMFIKEKIQFGKWVDAVNIWVIAWISA